MDYSVKEMYVHVTRNSKTGKKKALFGGAWGAMSKDDANSQGTLTGDGLMVVDIDTKDFSKIDSKLAGLLGEATVETANGFHYYFTGEVEEVKQTQGLFNLVDIRNKGGFVFSKYWGDDPSIFYKRIGEPKKLNDELKAVLLGASKTKSKTKVQNLNTVDGAWSNAGDGNHHSAILRLMVRDFKNGLTYDNVWTKSMVYIDKYLHGNHAHEDKLFEDRIDYTYNKHGNYGFKKLDSISVNDPAYVAPEIKRELVVIPEQDIIGNIAHMIADDTYEATAIIAEINKVSKAIERENYINLLSKTKDITKGAIREDLKTLYKNQIRANRSLTFPDYKESDMGVLYLSTIDNMKTLLKQEKINYFYDVILKDVVVKKHSGTNNWKGKLRSYMLSQALKSDLPRDIIENHWDIALRTKERNPLMEIVNNIEWDGEDHITALATTLKSSTGTPAYRREILMCWLIQCVASWDNSKRTPNKQAIAKYELIFVLGGNQGDKKTTFFYNLMPKKMSKYLLTGAILKVGDRDSVKQVTSFGMVELGELDATTKKSDIAEIKAFTSNTHDVYRVAYGRDDEKHPRRTSFSASVNPTSFLNDPTGARRFAYIRLDGEINTTDIDIMQVWAQVLQMYLDGERWWILPSDNAYTIQTEVNENATSAGTVGDTIFEFKKDLKKYGTKALHERVSATNLWELYRGRTPSKSERDIFYMELEKVKGLKTSRKNGISIPTAVRRRNKNQF